MVVLASDWDAFAVQAAPPADPQVMHRRVFQADRSVVGRGEAKAGDRAGRGRRPCHAKNLRYQRKRIGRDAPSRAVIAMNKGAAAISVTATVMISTAELIDGRGAHHQCRAEA